MMKYCEQRIPDGDPQKWTMGQLEDFGRIRLSSHFFMRDMLYSEVASVHGIRNVPDKPRLAVEVGHSLCESLLEPLLATFGHVAIRSAYRSGALHERGSKHRNMASIEKNRARHIGDLLDKNDKMGATACVVIPWFVQYLEARADMSWWIYTGRIPGEAFGVFRWRCALFGACRKPTCHKAFRQPWFRDRHTGGVIGGLLVWGP